MPAFGVVLDAEVLFSAPIRDTLLRVAEAGLYRLFWTEEILEEVRRNLVKNNKITEDQARQLISTLKLAFPEAMIPLSKYRRHLGKMQNHPKDRHVLAAAFGAGAQVIVTPNLRDFPKEALEPLNIKAQSPDAFLMDIFEMNPELTIQILKDQAEALKKPPQTLQDLLARLKLAAPKAVMKIEQYIEESL